MFPGVLLSKFKSLAPFRVPQASLHCIADELLWGDRFLRSSFLDLFNQLVGKSYAFLRHGFIVRLLANLAQTTFLTKSRKSLL
jgi:hypothetical protein